MAKPAAKRAPKKKGANGYKLPDPIPKGEILTDVAKNQWKIGPSIGVGGFGEIYSASEYGGKNSSKQYSYVVKIEPHGNGPLFVEMHFYMRNARQEDILAWMKQKRLATLGMPKYIGSGSHVCKDQKYRFVVMERFGKDLWTIFLESGRLFNESTVFLLGQQILDVLEYIHSRGYVHADVKGANVLMALDEKLDYQVYLVDFGLASHFSTKDFKPDPKKAHNGTIEYTSRDAHQGVPTRRGDLEILAYNMLQWLGHKLPWENNLSDPVKVQQSKEQFMSDIKTSFKINYPKISLTSSIVKYFIYVSTMKYDSVPDYTKCSKLFAEAVKDPSGAQPSALVFTTPPSKKVSSRRKGPLHEIAVPTKKSRSGTSRRKVNEDSSSENDDAEPFLNIPTRVSPMRELVTETTGLARKTKSMKQPVRGKRAGRNAPVILDESMEFDTSLDVSPVRKRGKSPKKTVVAKKQVGLTKRTQNAQKKDPTPMKKRLPIEKDDSESDMFSSFTEDTNKNGASSSAAIPKSRITRSRSQASSVDNTPVKLVTPRTKKRIAVKAPSTDDEEIIPGQTLKRKPYTSWKDCPTIQNGKTVK